MAIFGIKNEINEVIEEKNEKSIVPTYESDVKDTELLSLISGFKWVVTYFHREVKDNKLVTQFDPNLDITAQNFNRIDDFVIRVDSPLPAGPITDLNGSGIVDVNIIPSPNDIIVSKLMDGRTILFNVTNVGRINYNNNDIYHIEYKAYSEVKDNKDERFQALLKSTINEFEYNDKYRLNNHQPLYTKKQAKEKRKIGDEITKLVDYWQAKFITPDNNFYIGYRNKDESIYDPYLERFIKKVVGINNINRIETIDLDDNNVSILDKIMDDDLSVNRISEYTDFKNTNEFGNNPYLFSISYTGLDECIIVSPVDIYEDLNETIDINFPKVELGHYIFRKVIYDAIKGNDLNFSTLTKFEQLFITVMNGSIITDNVIIDLIDKSYGLPDKEQFYFMPILIYIAKYYVTTFTVEYV